MILLNSGIPVFVFEYPAMIIALVIVIAIEYNWLKKAGFTFAGVFWSNFVSTLVGVPLSVATRSFIANDLVSGGSVFDNPFKASLYMGGELSFEGGWFFVWLLILMFNCIFSILIEWGAYRSFYRTMPNRFLFKETLVANLITYGTLGLPIPLILFLIQLFA
jgi:hypothetical protein